MTNYRWTICAMLFFATTVNYLDRQVLSLTWDEFIKPEFHWDESHYGTITSVFSIVYAICMPVSYTHLKEILRLIETHIEENQKNLASYEKIKRFTLLSEPFTMGAELTDTLKLRRSVILKKYADPIEKMYEEASNMWGSNPV